MPSQRPIHPQAMLVRRCRGLSLIDLLCSLAITLVLLAGALPALQDLRLRQRLEGTAALLETDVHYARSLAQVMDQPVRLAIQALDDGGSCYVVHTGSSGSCRCDAQGQARCESGGRALRVVGQPVADGVRILHSGRSLLFDAGHGTVTPTATLAVTDRDGRTIHQILNILGRVRSCSPNGVSGYRRCS